MKFDYVIGNPPYNANLYIDFIQVAYYHSNKASSFIVPAKWVNLTSFGDKTWWLVKYLRDVVFYRNTGDVFQIGEPDGIMYYVMGKTPRTTYRLKGIDTIDKNYDFDWIGYNTPDTIGTFCLYNPTVKGIFEKLISVKSFKDILINNKYLLRRDYYTDKQNLLHDTKEKDTDIPLAMSVSNTSQIKYIARENAYCTEYLDKYKVITSTMECMKHNFNKMDFGYVPAGVGFYGSAEMVAMFDTEIEAKNCQGYLDSHFAQIITSLSISSSVINADLFRMLPYLDFRYQWEFCKEDNGVVKSLNKYLGLTDEEVAYIEKLDYGCARTDR